VLSSGFGDAVRLFACLRFDGCCCEAASHGLVSGEISISKSDGEGRGYEGLIWKAMLAGAEADPGCRR